MAEYNRRRVLSSLALATTVPLTGCGQLVAESETTTEPTVRTEQTADQTAEQTEQDTPTTTAESVAEASVTSSNLQITEGEYRTTAAVTGAIENTGNTPLLICNAIAKFYNSEDELLNTAAGQIMALLPGEIWIPWLRYSGDGGKVEKATLEVDSTTAASTQNLYSGESAFTFEESDVQIPTDEGAMPRINAKITNETGSEVARARFIGIVHDEEGRLLASGTSVVNGFGAGEVWNAEAAIYLGGDRADQISNHSVLLFSQR